MAANALLLVPEMWMCDISHWCKQDDLQSECLSKMAAIHPLTME